MKIIKSGNLGLHRFKCEHCDCEFEANSDEYTYRKKHEQMHFNEYADYNVWSCKCPECKELVVDEKRA